MKVSTPAHFTEHFDKETAGTQHPEEGTNAGNNTAFQYRAKTIDYAQTRPNTLAEVAAGAGKAVDFGSLGKLLTNKADGGSGIANPNGDFGYKYFIATSANLLNSNGGLQSINGTLVLPDGIYSGQSITLYAGSVAGANVESSKLWGVGRRLSDKKIDTLHLLPTGVALRHQEKLTLVWAYGLWLAHQDYRLLSGNGWCENEDGTVTIDPTPSPLNLAAYPAFTVAPTILDGSNGMSMASGGQY